MMMSIMMTPYYLVIIMEFVLIMRWYSSSRLVFKFLLPTSLL